MAPILTGNPYPILCLLAKSSEELKGNKKPHVGKLERELWEGDREAAQPSRLCLPDWLCLSFPTALQHADRHQPPQRELPALSPSHGVSLEGTQAWGRSHVQLRWGRHCQGTQGGSRDLPGPANRCLPAAELSQSGRRGFIPTAPAPSLTQRHSETGLRQTSVCFAGWAGSTSCLQKVFGGDRGCEASDFLALPHQRASLPQEMFQSMSHGQWALRQWVLR